MTSPSTVGSKVVSRFGFFGRRRPTRRYCPERSEPNSSTRRSASRCQEASGFDLRPSPFLRWEFGCSSAFEHMRLTVEVLATERGAICEQQASPTLYLSGMTGRIGAKGQVVIPKALRDRARLQPGDVVDFKLRDEEIVLVARRSPARLGGRFSKTGMAARLLEDRMVEPR